MLLRPTFKDFKVIAYYCGRLITGLGWAMLIPLIVAIIYTEIDPALIFVVSSMTSFIVGYLLTYLFYNTEDLTFLQSMVVVPMAWMLAMLLGAQPLYLSGHYLSYLDAMFDTMSGLTTTGFSLAIDLDHMSASVNLWRHLTMFLGGQGIVVVAISILNKTAGGIFGLYAGEAREEKIMPNVVQTARFIWIVSFTYLILGSLIMTAIMTYEGMHPGRAILQSVSLFMAAFDTGGFAPHSQSILYYHSALLESVLIFLMIAGAINFSVHYAIWTGKFKEIYRNIEIAAMSATIFLTFSITAIGLAAFGTYAGFDSLFRKSIFQIVSAHTTSGFMTIYPAQLEREWAPISIATMIVAMVLGGSISSTSGGIKALRLAITFKLFKLEIKKLVLPPAAVVVAKYHHLKSIVLTEGVIRNTLMILIAYVISFLVGVLFTMFAGYGFTESVFESISAGSNNGLSIGIVTPSMPDYLKVVYIVQMWSGRLEFLSIFAVIGIIWALVKGK